LILVEDLDQILDFELRNNQGQGKIKETEKCLDPDTEMRKNQGLAPIPG